MSELEALGWGCLEEISYWNADTCPEIIGRLLNELDAVTPEAEPEQVDPYAEETDPYAW